MHFTMNGSPVSQSQAAEKTKSKVAKANKEVVKRERVRVREVEAELVTEEQLPELFSPSFAFSTLLMCIAGFTAGMFGLAKFFPSILQSLGVL